MVKKGDGRDGPAGAANVLSRPLLDILVDSSSYPSLVVDETMNIVRMNEGARHLLGIKRLRGDTRLMELLPDASVQVLRDYMDGLLKDGSLSRECLIEIDVTGIRHRLTILRTDLKEDGRPSSAPVFILMLKLETVEASDPHNVRMATIGEFAAGIAHELNTPLANISLIAENLMETTDDQDVIGSMGKIIGQVEFSARIVKEILAFSRKGQPTFEMVDLNSVVMDVLSRMEVPARIMVNTPLEEGLSMVVADLYQIQEVVRNLIENAVDAIEDNGYITIRTRTAGNWVEVSVQDTGKGIPRENEEQVFQPFFTTKAHGKGVGLGLAICKRIIANHKGELHLRSRPGEGSVFTVRLPRGS